MLDSKYFDMHQCHLRREILSPKILVKKNLTKCFYMVYPLFS